MKCLLHSTQNCITEGTISERDLCQTNTQISFYSSSFHGWYVFSVRISWVNYDISCCCSVAKPCPALCNPMDCSTLGFPVLHISWSLLKLMSIETVMPSNYLVICCPLFLLPSVFPSIRVFSNKSFLLIRWPKCCSFSFSISPSSEYSGLISFRID